MKTPAKRATRRLAASLAIITALATGGAYAAGFWKGTGQDSGTAANWTNEKAFMADDDFFFRDAKMTEGATYTRAMRLTADVTSSKRIFFQCGTEADPFVVDGNNHTITLGWGGDIENSGNFFVGHSDNTGNDAGYYGSAVLNGGTWTCNQLYVGAGSAYTGYLRLNGASLTVTGTNEDPCDNGKIVVDDGTLSFTSGWVTIGRNGGTAEFVVNGGTVSCSGDLLFGNASGTLTVNGGTVTVVPVHSLRSWATGTVNLNGGTLGTYHLERGNEGCALTVNFNGGTLQANEVCADHGGLIEGGVTVNVNAGGIIDNGGYNIAIAAPLGGTGGLTFTGTGTTTLNGNVTYAGKTAVTPGTILAIANETAKNNILANGLIVAGLPTAGQTIVTYTSALEATDLEKVSCPLAPTTFKVGADGQSIVVDNVGSPINYWTGAAGDNNLSTQRNWSLNEVPAGNANIFSATPMTLTKGATFAPTSITFLEGSAGVTIGGDFTSLTRIINNSYVSQTFSGAVNFGSGNIDVVQTGFCNNDGTVAGGCVVFAGGVTGNNIANHTVFTGNYTLTTTDNINFMSGGTSRFVVNAGSTLTVKKTDQIQELYIMSGATLHTEYASHWWGASGGENRLWCWNAGTFIADRYEFHGHGSQWLGGYVGNPISVALNANGVLKIGTLNITDDGVVMLHGNYNVGNVGDALTTYIGEGGLNIAEGKTGYYLVENYTHRSTLRPLNSNFTFGKGSNASYDFRIGNGGGNINFTFHTDDEQGVAREITLAARVYTEQNTSSITVKGGGTLKVTSASPDMIGSTVVADTATLAFGAGASFGAAGTAGAITLGNGTTLALTSTGKALSPLANALNLPTGAGEVATIRIDGGWLSSGDHEIATVGNAAATANVTLDENSTALAGRKYTLKVENGKLLLNIKFAGTIVIIR